MISELIRHLLVILVITINLSVCLYEDQVGKFDWKQRYVGKIKYSHIDLKSKEKRVFVGTESNVVSALSLKTGAILWRQVLEAGDPGAIRHFSVGSEVVTISGSNPYLVRGWNPNAGFLVFEWPITLSESDPNAYWDVDQGKLLQVQSINGALEITSYNSRTGSPLGSVKTISVPGLSSASRCSLSRGTLSCLTNEGKDLATVALPDGELKTLPLGFVSVGLSPLPSPMPSLLLTLPDGSQKVASIIQGEISVAEVPPMSSVALYKYGENHVMLSVTASGGAYEIQGKILESGEALADLSGRVQHLFPLTTASISDMACGSIDNRISCFVLLSADDDSAILLSPSRIIWIREEALANIISVEMLDLPVSDVEAAIEKEFANKEGGMLGMFVRRVNSQIAQLQTFVASLLGIQESSGGSLEKEMVKDTFGLHKLIIVVTKIAKVYGIDNLSGEIVWRNLIKDVEPCLSLGKPTVPIYVQRTTRVLPHPAQWTLLFRHKETQNSVLYVFNPISGQPLKGGKIPLSYRAVQAILLPAADSEFVKGLVLLSSTGQVDVFPPSTKEIALATASTVFLYTVDPASGLISGYTFAYSTPAELKATLVWNVRLSPGIIAVKGKNPQEKVHSQGRVLADRSVLYKYINPNLIAVATQAQDPVHKNVLSVYLLDAVSGRIVFSVVHKRASEPVHLVHSENWVVYTYFSDKTRRTEIVALDLYEGKTQANTTAFSSILQRVDPFVERQAYIFPYHVMAMRETITEKGITSKHILVGLGSGSVFEVPWVILDPRRSIAPTPEMREEGVIPYVPEVGLPHETYITYNHTLHNIAGIHTSPAGLESTCLVFVYGLDIFYTRVAPSRTFDVLKDDFEYWLISAVLGGLTLAAYITKLLSSRTALRQAWK